MVALVTGRPPRWLHPVAEATGHPGVAVCANGALLYDLHTERIVDSTLLDPDTLRTVAARLRAAVPGLRFAVEYGRGLRPRAGLPALLGDRRRGRPGRRGRGDPGPAGGEAAGAAPDDVAGRAARAGDAS